MENIPLDIYLNIYDYLDRYTDKINFIILSREVYKLLNHKFKQEISNLSLSSNLHWKFIHFIRIEDIYGINVIKNSIDEYFYITSVLYCLEFSEIDVLQKIIKNKNIVKFIKMLDKSHLSENIIKLIDTF
ncbi:unnamed protein product [marine sediment metagenome]|uniref:Uncharacterized protein n=1 Tax=marine sediment metagenome TaxID=412755 RepID=X0V3Q2_9ZZZZ